MPCGSPDGDQWPVFPTLVQRDDGGCLFEVRCYCDDEAEWMEFYPGWVSWLLVLKAAADFAVDLRNGAEDRTWMQRFVDQ